MKRSIKSIISIITIFSLAGCTTAIIRTEGTFDSRSSKKESLVIDNFNATKSRGALFVQGKIINESGSELTNIELEARGFDKSKQLISTDKIKISPNRLKNKERVGFNATFTKNIDRIDSYHFVGRYDLIKTEIKADWHTLGVVLLTAGTAIALAAAAYGQYYNSMPNYQYRPTYQQQPSTYYIPPSISTQSRPQVNFVNTEIRKNNGRVATDDKGNPITFTQVNSRPTAGGVFGKFNPNNPFSEYNKVGGKYNPNNPFSEYNRLGGSLNSNNPFSETNRLSGSLNPNNPFSEISSLSGRLNPKNPFSEVSNPFGKFNPSNPFSEGIHPYYYQKDYLEDDE